MTLERDNETYWVERHKRFRHKLASVGDISRSEEDNLELYARKKRSVATLLRHLEMLDLTGLRVLDAGCGVGMLSELFYVLGAEVSGVDASPTAIAECQRRCPTGAFHTGSLIDFAFNEQFDLTVAFDVLYHVVDDDNWRATLANLVAHTELGGHLAVLDQLKHEPYSPASHVRFRTHAMYDDALFELGMKVASNPNEHTFLVYNRPD
jgi:2-polyprenyl-3-methyl-5-hydroxy-6-metoxy-1,4-benzoquinol methylase